VNLDLGCLDNLKGHRAATEGLHQGRHRLDRGVLHPRLLVHLLDLLRIVEQFALIERFTRLGRDLLAQPVHAETLVSGEAHLGQNRLALDNVGQRQLAIRESLLGDADVVEETRAIEVLDIIVGCQLVERVARLDADVGADEVLADGGGPHEFDADAAHIGGRRGARAWTLRVQGHGQQQQAARPQPHFQYPTAPARHSCLSLSCVRFHSAK
jgi:hypothetical protein